MMLAVLSLTLPTAGFPRGFAQGSVIHFRPLCSNPKWDTVPATCNAGNYAGRIRRTYNPHSKR